MSSCIDSIENISKVCHTLVIWSNIFYIISIVVLLYTKHYIPAMIFSAISFFSIFQHANYNVIFSETTWERLDVIVSLISIVLLIMYIHRQKIDVKERKMLTILFSVLIMVAIFTFIVSQIITKNLDKNDPNKGIFGPFKLSMVAPEQICYNHSLQIKYMIYHIMWHILSGMISIFFTITILM